MRARLVILALLLAFPLRAQAQQEGDGKMVMTAGKSLDAFIESSEIPVITGQRISCDGGKAAGFACNNVDLLSFLPITALGGIKDTTRLNDIWGWTDPTTGKEYALVGRSDGTAFVDVSDPINPRFVGSLPLTAGAQRSVWRDIKVYKNHAFIVADAALAHGVQIFDLERLRSVGSSPVTFDEDVVYREINSAHNIAINEQSGFAYSVGNSRGGETCGGGLHMINISDPKQPEFAGCYAEPLTGRARTGYTHDTQCVIYHGPDSDYTGREICVSSNENAVVVSDVTDKDAPYTISIAEYPSFQYTHQGWLTPDHTHFLLDDEGDELAEFPDVRTRTLIWNLEDLDDPVLETEYRGATTAIDHNQYVVKNRAFQANYASGLRVVDLTDIKNPREVGYFDTYTPTDDARADGFVQFQGAWSNYPFFASGIVVISSIREGLFVVTPTGPAKTNIDEEEIPTGFRLIHAYPNPFNPQTTIALEVDRPQDVRLAVYDVQGKEVGEVFSGRISAPGRHEFAFDAAGLASGVYLVRVSTPTGSQSISITLQK